MIKGSLDIFKNTISPGASSHKCHHSHSSSSSAARLYPTNRQATVPQQGGAGAGAFPGGGGGLASRTAFLRRSANSKTAKTTGTTTTTDASPSSYQTQNANFANYQNCTIVRSHTPHANYGYVKVAPKILIFPIFVQVGNFMCLSVTARI